MVWIDPNLNTKCQSEQWEIFEGAVRTRGKLFDATSLKGKKNKHDKIGD